MASQMNLGPLGTLKIKFGLQRQTLFAEDDLVCQQKKSLITSLEAR